MSDRFYTPELLSAGEFVLDGAEAHHLVTVRRFQNGDQVVLFNGDGHDYPAEILSADRKQVVLSVRAGIAVERELPFRMELAVALPKGNRGDFLIEKLTELGVRRLVPLLTARTIVQPKDNRIDNLQHEVIEASKQSGRNTLMTIESPMRWPRFVIGSDLPLVRILLHPPRTGTTPCNLKDIPAAAIRGGGVICAVGPEGGFSEEEVAMAEDLGWIRLSLGPRILRVETSAIAVASWASLLGCCAEGAT